MSVRQEIRIIEHWSESDDAILLTPCNGEYMLHHSDGNVRLDLSEAQLDWLRDRIDLLLPRRGEVSRQGATA